jgi:hypothetical protein
MQNQRRAVQKPEELEQDKRTKKKVQQPIYDQLKTPKEGDAPTTNNLVGLTVDSNAALLAELNSYEQKIELVTQLQQSQGNNYVQKVIERIKAQEGSGQPLAEETRSEMEANFGEDFSSVRIHTDSAADQITSDVDAIALTSGKDVFFKSGQYQPGSESGKQLLRHELTHVIQQSNNGTKAESISQRGDVFEKEANQVASSLGRGAEISVAVASATPGVQLQFGDLLGAVAGGVMPAVADTAKTEALAILQQVVAELASGNPDFGSILSRLMEALDKIRQAATSALTGGAGNAVSGLAGAATNAIGSLFG